MSYFQVQQEKIRSVLTKINTFFVYNKTILNLKKEKNINLDEDISRENFNYIQTQI